MHKGSIKGVTICKDKFSTDECLDPDWTQEENGIDGEEEEIKILYDYQVVDYPQLK